MALTVPGTISRTLHILTHLIIRQTYEIETIIIITPFYKLGVGGTEINIFIFTAQFEVEEGWRQLLYLLCFTVTSSIQKPKGHSSNREEHVEGEDTD